MKKLIRISIFTVLLLTTGCGLKTGYYTYPSKIYNDCNNHKKGGLVSGTILTPQGMYMINGMDFGNGMRSGTIISPSGGMSFYQFME